MSCLTADENGLYQCFHTAMTLQLRIIPLVGEGAKEVPSIIFSLQVTNTEKHQDKH